jgi:DNA-binding NarL/FixJ family response regulator
VTRVIIADPDSKSRNAILLWLVYKLGIDEIIQVSNGDSLMEALEDNIPDLIMMDWSLPQRPPLEVFRKIQEESPHLQWIILSVNADTWKQAKKYTHWFLQKGLPPENLLTLVQEVIGIKSV